MDATLAAGTYRILLCILEALVAIQERCLEQPDSDADADRLFWECQRLVDLALPMAERLAAGPELPPAVMAFLTELER